MLHEIFYWIFNMSITAAITGIIVMLIRLVKRIPRRITIFLWIIPFLRMVFPLGLNSKYSLLSLISQITTKTIIVYRPGGINFSMTNMVMAADSYFPISYKKDMLAQVFHIASIIWIIISAVLLLILIFTYFTTIRQLKDSESLRENIYFSKKISTPGVYGILRPKIILPFLYKDKNIELIVMHEKMHVHTQDNLWRIVALVVGAFHWFNPFCWIFLKMFLEDLELACDERVVARLGQERAKEYAVTLLHSAKSQNIFISAFGGAKIRKRIENILSFKKMTGLALVAFIMLIVIIFYILLTNAD